MARGFWIWILFICFHTQIVSSESPNQMLLVLKQKFVQQPDCTPNFEIRHPGYISCNATGYPSITTDDECRSTCIKDEKCMSYQVDLRPGQIFCRIQTSYSIEDLQGPFNAAEMKEYVFITKCVLSTSKGNGNAGQCNPLIELRLRNWNTFRAREEPSVKSEMECRDICFKDQDCMSYHIDKNPDHPLCYIQKDLEMLNKYQLYMSELVKEYFIVDRCFDKYDVSYKKDCSPVFKKLYEEVSLSTTPYPFTTTEQLCRLTCLFAPDCVSYQIDRNPGAVFCWIQTDGNNLWQGKRAQKDLVTEYILVNPCTNKPFDNSASGCTSFVFPKPYPGISNDATAHAEIQNNLGCRSLCLATPSCVSYQDSSTGIRCWTQHDWKNLLPHKSFFSTDVKEYVVARKCLKEYLVIEPDYEIKIPELAVDDCNKENLRSEGDIVLAICTTGIVRGDTKSEERLKALKTFVSDFVVSLRVASNGDRVALVTFESKAYVEFNLNTYNDPKLIVQAVAKVGCHECGTKEANVVSALATIKTEVLTTAKGRRPDVPQMIILITDRLPAIIDPGARDAMVKDLANDGACIIPIGVADMVDGDKLKGFASTKNDGKPQNLLWVHSFASLNTLVRRLHETIYEVIPSKYLHYCM